MLEESKAGQQTYNNKDSKERKWCYDGAACPVDILSHWSALRHLLYLEPRSFFLHLQQTSTH